MKRHDTLYSIFQIILWEGWRKRIKSIRIAAFSALLFLSHISCAQKTGTIHVLIVTGMDIEAHDWRKTTPAIREELEKDPRMQVDTLTDIYALSGYNLSPYDVVYLNFNNWKKPDPDKKAQRNLEQFVAKGGGLVVAHFASGSFEGWPEYAKLAGRVWDRMNTHDPRDPFRVEITDTSHPITKGMTSFDTDDELYICLTGEEPIHVLAQAKSVVTGKYHPMVFTHSYKKGRTFHIALGHDAKAIHIPGTAELIRRGVAWAAGKEATVVTR